MPPAISRALLLCLLLAACSRDPDIAGRWTATDEAGDTGTFIFRENGTALIVRRAQAYDLRYEVNGSEQPMWLDLFMVTEDGDTTRIPGIMEVLEPDIIRYRAGTELDGDRPADFAGDAEVEHPGVVLRRHPRPE
jgi:hypothetical protein